MSQKIEINKTLCVSMNCCGKGALHKMLSYMNEHNVTQRSKLKIIKSNDTLHLCISESVLLKLHRIYCEGTVLVSLLPVPTCA